ncbi:MAG: hypothetical protein KGJ58_01545 [Patescibacteria group bacterium]|nr:hypothetical protein [Patescibacteria group bacterium]
MNDKNNKNQDMENKISYDRLNLKTISIFQNDANVIFIFKKTERLASAIYLITSFISDNEPIKWKMRDTAGKLLSHGINLSNQGHRNRADAMNNFTAASFEMISLLEVANISGIISSMNCNIIKYEIEKIIDLVELKERSLSAKFLLSKNFFDTSENYSGADGKSGQTSSSQNEKDIGTMSQNSDDKETVSKTNSYKRHLIKDTSKGEGNNVSFIKGHIVRGKDKRYETIINLLKKTKEIGVKDVSSILFDCSEKTIQRELLSLVAKGVLKKEGERRWSKYSLAS